MFKEITCIGNLGNDPEIRHLPSGTTAASFSVAVNDPPYTDKSSGEIVKNVTWLRVVAYQTGETGLVTNLIQKWLRKGQLVYVKGDPILRKYTDKEGHERTAFEIKLGPQSTIKMLGGEKTNGHARAEPNGVAPSSDPADINLGDIPI
jgi:single-strand DNA-binding protein